MDSLMPISPTVFTMCRFLGIGRIKLKNLTIATPLAGDNRTIYSFSFADDLDEALEAVAGHRAVTAD